MLTLHRIVTVSTGAKQTQKLCSLLILLDLPTAVGAF